MPEYKQNLTIKKFDLVFVLPIAILAGLIFSSIEGISGTLIWLFGMPMHEVGHALGYWISGILAIPVPLMTVPLHSETYFISMIIVGAAIYLLYRFARKNNSAFFKFLSGLFAALLILFSLILSSKTCEMVMLYGGLGGEIYLSLLMILIACQELPRYSSWSVKRLIFLGWGSLIFSGTILKWFKIRSGHEKLPMGGAIDPDAWFGGESNGDLDRLIREFGWTEDFVVKVYSITCVSCIMILVLYYTWMVLQKIKSNNTA